MERNKYHFWLLGNKHRTHFDNIFTNSLGENIVAMTKKHYFEINNKPYLEDKSNQKILVCQIFMLCSCCYKRIQDLPDLHYIQVGLVKRVSYYFGHKLP